MLCVVTWPPSNTKLFHFSFYFLFWHLLLLLLSLPQPVVAASVLLSSSFLPFFTSIAYSFFLFFFHLFTPMILWVLLYFFMGLFVFVSVGFVWAYAEERERERETAAGFLFMGCVFVRWLGCVSWVFKGWDRWVWVAVVVGGGVALLACRAEQSRCSCYVHWWRVQPDATVSFWV